MPLYYTDIESEHRAVRTACGVFDVSHMGEVMVSGEDAMRFVNHIFTGDVSTLAVGDVVYGMMLHDNGGTVDDLLVYRIGAEAYLLVINASNIDKDVAHIRAQAAEFSGVRIEDISATTALVVAICKYGHARRRLWYQPCAACNFCHRNVW